MKTKLFRDALVLQFSGEGLDTTAEVIRANVGVEDARIAFVGEIPAHFKAQTELSAADCILMPGLVNSHTHIPMTLFRNAADDMPLLTWLESRIWPAEAKLTGQDAYWGAMLALAEMMRGGVTAINDMYFFTDDFAPAVEQSGMRALLSRAIVTDGEGNDRYFREALALHDKWDGAGNGRIRVALAPHAEYTCDIPTLERVASEAKARQCPIHVHISESKQEHDDCLKRHGMTPAALFQKCGLLGEKTLLAHGVHLEMQDIEILAGARAHVLHNPQSNLKLGSGIAPVPVMMKAGLNVALGTDGAASNNNLDMWEELRLAATLHKGTAHDATLIPAAVALHMATRAGAYALGMGCANLEAGQPADICVVKLGAPHFLPLNDPVSALAYCAGASDVSMTMIDGEVVYAYGRHYTIDMQRVATEIAAISDRLRS